MKLYAPEYYKEFKCIADRCTHSCCVGWEIGVDGNTIDRYGELPTHEREEILSHIKDGSIVMTREGRCPFLDEKGLCRIISRYGDSFTSEICREHPRFYNFFGNRAEVGLGASCEEAARIILSSDSYGNIEAVGEIDGEGESEFDSTSDRSFIYNLLKNSGLSYHEKLSRIKKKYYLPDGIFLEASIYEKLSGLEYLRDEDKQIICASLVSGREEDFLYCERFLAYLIYRHLGASCSFDNMRARLCVCVLLARVFESLLSIKVDKIQAARLISEEIEYSDDNVDSLIFDFECEL